MRSRITTSLAVLMALALSGLVQATAGGSAFATQIRSTATPFEITSATPSPSNLTIPANAQSASKKVTIKWEGKADFPLTVVLTPSKTCAEQVRGFVCSPGTAMILRHEDPIVVPNGWSCFRDRFVATGSVSSVYYLYMVYKADGEKHRTPTVKMYFTCSW